MKDLFIFVLTLTKYFFIVVGFIIMAITTGFIFCYYLVESVIDLLNIKINRYERKSNADKD